MTENIATTHEEAAKNEELMKAPFPVTLATVAKALNTTELASAQKMPDDAVAFVTGSIAERFGALWGALGGTCHLAEGDAFYCPRRSRL